MTEVTNLPLALFDLIPPLLFLLGSYFMVRMAWLTGGRVTGQLAMLGSTLTFLAGFLKATHKVITAAGGPDITLFSQQQFVLAAPGFVLLLITAIQIARTQRPWALKRLAPDQTGAPVLMMAGWKIPFLAVMTLSSMGLNGILAYVAFQRRARLAAAGYIIAFLGLVAMGALASGEQTITRQWIEEINNAFAQGGYLLGCAMLYRSIKREPHA